MSQKTSAINLCLFPPSLDLGPCLVTTVTSLDPGSSLLSCWI